METTDPIMLAMAADVVDSKLKPVPEPVARGLVAPSPQVGDRWVYHREIRDGDGLTRRNYVTLTVAQAGPGGHEVHSSASELPYRYDANGNLQSMPAPSGPGTVVIDPADVLLRFPLQAGATWSGTTREVWPAFSKSAENMVTAVGWESVQVPAGTFQAMKISKVAAHAWEPFPGQALRSKRVTNVWFVPALRTFARYETLEVTATGTVLADQTWELDGFKVN